MDVASCEPGVFAFLDVDERKLLVMMELTPLENHICAVIYSHNIVTAMADGAVVTQDVFAVSCPDALRTASIHVTLVNDDVGRADEFHHSTLTIPLFGMSQGEVFQFDIAAS